MDSQVSDVQGTSRQAAPADKACQVLVRLDMEMKLFLRVTYVVFWAWFVILFGPKPKR